MIFSEVEARDFEAFFKKGGKSRNKKEGGANNFPPVCFRMVFYRVVIILFMHAQFMDDPPPTQTPPKTPGEKRMEAPNVPIRRSLFGRPRAEEKGPANWPRSWDTWVGPAITGVNFKLCRHVICSSTLIGLFKWWHTEWAERLMMDDVTTSTLCLALGGVGRAYQRAIIHHIKDARSWDKSRRNCKGINWKLK